MTLGWLWLECGLAYKATLDSVVVCPFALAVMPALFYPCVDSFHFGFLKEPMYADDDIIQVSHGHKPGRYPTL